MEERHSMEEVHSMEERQSKIIVAGHVCLDITPVFSGQEGNSLGEIFSPGKLLQMKQAEVHTGGCVANTGLAMKLLGADVSLMGKVGADEFGSIIKRIFSEHHAGQGLIAVSEESTSYSVILAPPGIDRIFLHNPGANDTFCADDIPDKSLEGCALFHFGYPTLMRRMYEEEGKELLRIFRKAKDAGAATSLDFAMVNEDTDAGRACWEKILEKVLPSVDFFVPSVEELCFMLDKERFVQWQQRACGRDITEILDAGRDVRPLADRCMELGAKVLLIKCGSTGMYYRTACRETLLAISDRIKLQVEEWENQEGFEKSYRPDRVLSGSGAGDTSIAAFLVSMLNGRSLQQAVRLAAAAGASCVASYDALSGLRSLDELEARIEAGWEKV